jgi:hypothetical protein
MEFSGQLWGPEQWAQKILNLGISAKEKRYQGKWDLSLAQYRWTVM